MVIWFLTRFYSSYEVFTLFDIPSFRLNFKTKKKKKKKKKKNAERRVLLGVAHKVL